MKGKLLNFVLFSMLLLAGTYVNAQAAKEIDSYLQGLHAIHQFNGNVLVANRQQLIYQKSLGFADLDKKTGLTGASQFPIASVSKTFTATAILQLRQKGKLQLDDAVKQYLPDFPYPEVTIRHLLSNTSGLGQYYNLFDSMMIQQPDKVITNSDIIPAFVAYRTPLRFVPGARWEYNNVNFCIAALIVERLSGLSFADYLQRFIFKPAGMNNSLLPANRKLMQPKQVERHAFANLYTTTLENIKNIPESFKIEGRSNFYGNGGIVSTAEDLYKFDKGLYNGLLVAPEALTEAFTPAKLNDGTTVSYHLDEKEVSYGLGWEIYTDEKQGKIVFHDGSITGLTSILVRNISKGQTIILLENTGSNAVFSASNAISDILNQQPYKPVTQGFARLYGNSLVYQGEEAAHTLLTTYLRHPEKYSVTEREMIRQGYELIRHNKKQEAAVVFGAATKIFPQSWNAFDSYGEALLLIGRKEEAVKMYHRSIELNPNNENGKKVLKEISGN